MIFNPTHRGFFCLYKGEHYTPPYLTAQSPQSQ